MNALDVGLIVSVVFAVLSLSAGILATRTSSRTSNAEREAREALDSLIKTLEGISRRDAKSIEAKIARVGQLSSELDALNGELKAEFDVQIEATRLAQERAAEAARMADDAEAIASARQDVVDALTQRYRADLETQLAKALADEREKARKGRALRWFAGFASGVAASIVAALLYTWVPILLKGWHLGS